MEPFEGRQTARLKLQEDGVQGRCGGFEALKAGKRTVAPPTRHSVGPLRTVSVLEGYQTAVLNP